MKILLTGGAGFVGSRLALRFRQAMPDSEIVAFDNLRRRGGEINLQVFREHNIQFVHGDIRNPGDFEELGSNFDLLIEASAEPSVHAGLSGSTDYVIQTNLGGTINCLNFARRHCDKTVFLSTSRVYSIEPLQKLPLQETSTRLDLPKDFQGVGVSHAGIAEDFPTDTYRSLYGATKLCSELLLQEYCQSFGVKALVNRCGVIAGPGQFGKVDQGVFTLWVARHHFGLPLRYTGFGGQGKQVRDLLHPDDLFRLIQQQLDDDTAFDGTSYNIGGGRAVSTSLLELTGHCVEATGKKIPIASDPTTAAVDIPYYVTDSSRAASKFNWQPEKTVPVIVDEIAQWIRDNEKALKPIFAG